MSLSGLELGWESGFLNGVSSPSPCPLPQGARVFREILRFAQDDRQLGLRTGSGGGSRIGGRVAVNVLSEALGKSRGDFLLEGLEGAVGGFRVVQVAFAAGAGYAADHVLVSLAQHDEIRAPADIAKLRVRHLNRPEACLTPDQQVRVGDFP